MSTKAHEKCAVCGSLVHVGYDGEMVARVVSGTVGRAEWGVAWATSDEKVAVHALCRNVSEGMYDRRRGEVSKAGRRAQDRRNEEILRRMWTQRMWTLEGATPRQRRRHLREWFGKA